MIKKFILITILSIINITNFFGFPFSLGVFQNVDFKSKENLYYIRKEQLSGFDKYKKEGVYFFCISDSCSELNYKEIKEKMVIGRFRVLVLSKNEKINYKIKDIKVDTGSKIFDMKDILYLPYPYETPLITEFKMDNRFSPYFSSWFYLGYFKFPIENKKEVVIKVTIEINSIQHTFEYPYIVNKEISFLRLYD